MKKQQVENYIKKLKELDSKINLENPEGEMSGNFISELDSVLGQMTTDLQGEMAAKVKIVPVLNVNFKKLTPQAVTPTYAKEGDAGLDLTITSIISNTTFQVIYGTGIAIEIPEGHVGLVFPRSSVRNYDLILANCIGVIDSIYRGEIELTFNKNTGLDSYKYDIGDRGAQLIILPYPNINLIEKKELTKTVRNTDGHGSTGN